MYSLDMRKVAIRLYSLFHSLRKTSYILQTSHSTIWRWLKDIPRKQYDRIKPTKSSMIIETLRSIILSNPFTHIHRIREMIKECCQVTVSKELIRVSLYKIGFTRKKARFFSKPSSMENKTIEFIKQRDKFIEQGKHFFSIDETSFGRRMKDVYGYSLKGERLIFPRKDCRKTTCSYLVIISTSKIEMKQKTIEPFNTLSFYEFLTQIDFPNNSVLLLDNVKFHHSSIIKEYAEMIGLTLLYTPPYSPWFNPIEGIFSIVKRHYYQHQNIEDAFDNVSRKHIHSFFQKSNSIKKFEIMI